MPRTSLVLHSLTFSSLMRHHFSSGRRRAFLAEREWRPATRLRLRERAGVASARSPAVVLYEAVIPPFERRVSSWLWLRMREERRRGGDARLGGGDADAAFSVDARGVGSGDV
jgi:hypothetical protein